jgi:hypothetical protein
MVSVRVRDSTTGLLFMYPLSSPVHACLTPCSCIPPPTDEGRVPYARPRAALVGHLCHRRRLHAGVLGM